MQSKASKGINMRNSSFLLCVLLLVGGVSGDKVEVSVMEEDSVTLKPDAAEVQREGDLQWKFQISIIAKIETTGHVVYTPKGTGKFRDRLKLDNQTGFLTITNISTADSGDYEFKIKNNKEIIREFSLAVRDEMKPVSVKEGEPFILGTGLIEIKGYDLIIWKFKEQNITEINKGTNGTLFIDHQTGSLINIKSRMTDSGDYQLHMISSSHTVQRNISVTVSEPSKPPEPSKPSEPSKATKVLAVLLSLSLMVILILIVVGIKCWKKVSRPNPPGPDSTLEMLNVQTSDTRTV